MPAFKSEKLQSFLAWAGRRWKLLLGLLLLAVIVWIVLGFFPGGGKRDNFNGGPVPVALATASKGDIDVHLDALGTVQPLSTVTLHTRIDGQLMRVGFREGDLVKAGQFLAEIDPRPYQVQLVQAVGQYEKDKALLDNAQRDLERYRKLIELESISRQQLDTQESLVRQYQGTLAADRGTVDNAKLQLVYTRITAPLGGRVGLRQVDPGNMVHASDTNGLVVITQLQPITVVFSVPQDNIGAIMQRLAAKEKLVVKAYDREQKLELASGILLTVDNQIDTTTGTVKLKAQFANDKLGLFPNQFVNVRLRLETRKDATLIPSSAVQRGKGNATFVYVLKDDQSVTVRPIRLGTVEGETAAVEEGLAPGDVVVADGTDKLREGARIKARPSADAATPAADAGERKKHQRKDKQEEGATAAAAPGKP